MGSIFTKFINETQFHNPTVNLLVADSLVAYRGPVVGDQIKKINGNYVSVDPPIKLVDITLAADYPSQKEYTGFAGLRHIGCSLHSREELASSGTSFLMSP